MSIDPLLHTPRREPTDEPPPRAARSPRPARPPRAPRGADGLPRLALVGAVLAVVAIGAWALFGRGGDSPAEHTTRPATTAPDDNAPAAPPAQVESEVGAESQDVPQLPPLDEALDQADDPNTDPVTGEIDAVEPANAPTTAVTDPGAEAHPGSTPGIDVVGSDWWLVNPSRPLPDGYVPPDLVTPNVPIKPGAAYTQAAPRVAQAFEQMVAAALQVGHELQLTSGYRSLEEQQVVYDRFVRDYGRDVAGGLVAVPGTSEHQTGLAVDVGEVGLPDDEIFADTASSGWVSANAHRFGFILRYPPSKADITGYSNEPWHLRYVGVELATQLHASGLTMEEHFGLVPARTSG